MGFGNIGIGELMMILLVVMVVFGPKRLPEIARNMGKFMRDFRRETNAAIKELKEGIEPIKVGIFDEPDAASDVADNGSPGRPGPLPGVAAAGGAGTVEPVTAAVSREAPGNGARKPAAKRKPAAGRTSGTRSKPASAARRKSPASATKKRTAARKPKSSSTRTNRASRKR